jgi:ABC-type amino acid transport substrate-binding protein
LKKKLQRFWKNHGKNLLNRRTIPILLCIVGILVVFISVTSMGGSDSDKINPADTAFAKKSRILVGVVPDQDVFCKIDENGNAIGYEAELLRTMFMEMYPGVPVVFQEIDSQMASYDLKHGNIDIAIGMFSKDVTKTQGLSLTVPYYTDGLYAYSTGGKNTSLASLQGTSVYLLTTEYPGGLATKAFAEMGLELETVSCSSYPDAVDSIMNGSASAVVGAFRRMESKNLPLQRIDQRIADVSYRILLWKDNSDITALINAKLNEMLENGSLDALREKYGLETSTK